MSNTNYKVDMIDMYIEFWTQHFENMKSFSANLDHSLNENINKYQNWSEWLIQKLENKAEYVIKFEMNNKNP